jgi:sigma-B regulation protein RsbQ
MAALVLIAPSPYFLNDGEYTGGFEPAHIDDIVRFIHEDRDVWAESFASPVVGEEAQSKVARDFVQSFCATHPPAAEQFAHLAFRLDQRAELCKVRLPTHIVQSSDDPLAPVAVGEYMRDAIASSELGVVRCIGHKPHLSVPEACSQLVLGFLKRIGLMQA